MTQTLIGCRLDCKRGRNSVSKSQVPIHGFLAEAYDNGKCKKFDMGS